MKSRRVPSFPSLAIQSCFSLIQQSSRSAGFSRESVSDFAAPWFRRLFAAQLLRAIVIATVIGLASSTALQLRSAMESSSKHLVAAGNTWLQQVPSSEKG